MRYKSKQSGYLLLELNALTRELLVNKYYQRLFQREPPIERHRFRPLIVIADIHALNAIVSAVDAVIRKLGDTTLSACECDPSGMEGITLQTMIIASYEDQHHLPFMTGEHIAAQGISAFVIHVTKHCGGAVEGNIAFHDPAVGLFVQIKAMPLGLTARRRNITNEVVA